MDRNEFISNLEACKANAFYIARRWSQYRFQQGRLDERYDCRQKAWKQFHSTIGGNITALQTSPTKITEHLIRLKSYEKAT